MLNWQKFVLGVLYLTVFLMIAVMWMGPSLEHRVQNAYGGYVLILLLAVYALVMVILCASIKVAHNAWALEDPLPEKPRSPAMFSEFEPPIVEPAQPAQGQPMIPVVLKDHQAKL